MEKDNTAQLIMLLQEAYRLTEIMETPEAVSWRERVSEIILIEE